MHSTIQINKRLIGTGYPTYIVAEISANHNQNYNQTVELIKEAKAAGADAVKVQTYTADTMTIKSNKKYFRISGGTPWDGKTLYDLYKEASMPWEWQPRLKALANELGLDFFSTAFDSVSVDFLEEMKVPVHKVASFEIVDTPLIEKMARTRKPLLISTGMASLEEIGEAVGAARKAGANQIALLKCTSAYPASPADMHLRGISKLAETFEVPVGLSDHTLSSVVPLAAVALGACLVEKHLTHSRSIRGPDSDFSLEPSEFRDLVSSIREAEVALGQPEFCGEKEGASKAFRRSLFAVRKIRAGELFTPENVRSIRPAGGLPPKYIYDVIGHHASRDIERGTPLRWEFVSG